MIFIKKTISIAVVLLVATMSQVAVAEEAKKVTVFNYVRAESDRTMQDYVNGGAFGKINHLRVPTPIDKQKVIRMAVDFLYSFIVLDLSSPVIITKPDLGGRFQSMLVVSQDHYALPVGHGSGQFILTQEKVGTRYAFVIFRTFADSNNLADVKVANAAQDMIKIEQKNIGEFNVPNWDKVSLTKIRQTLNILAEDITDSSALFGDKAHIDPINHLLGAAYGWGGNPKEAAVYINAVPEDNDGKTAYVLTVKDVPVNGFWSVTVYNKEGYMQKNDAGIYNYNSVTAKRNADNSVTIHFGGDKNSINYIDITEGWNYIVRLYQPKGEVLNGKWNFPKATVAK